MKLLHAIIAAIVIALVAPLFFLDRSGPPAGAPASGELPWQIEVRPDGSSRVFGLMPGISTLADARERFGKELEIALIAAPGEAGSVEAYNSSVSLGGITGRIIVATVLPPERLQAMKERSLKNDFMESATRKFTLHPDDFAAALSLPVHAISFIPTVNLDAEMVQQRFGPPAERIRLKETLEHFLYPDKGLDVVLDSKGKEVLQYVAPRDFEGLRAPLRAAAAAAPAPAQ